MLRRLLRWLCLMDGPARTRRLSPEDLAKLVRVDELHSDADRTLGGGPTHQDHGNGNSNRCN